MHKKQIEQDILKLLGEKDKELQVSGRMFFTEGIIDYKHARGWLIVQRYWNERKKDNKRTNLEIMDDLSIEYDVTIEHVKYLLRFKV